MIRLSGFYGDEYPDSPKYSQLSQENRKLSESQSVQMRLSPVKGKPSSVLFGSLQHVGHWKGHRGIFNNFFQSTPQLLPNSPCPSVGVKFNSLNRTRTLSAATTPHFSFACHSVNASLKRAENTFGLIDCDWLADDRNTTTSPSHFLVQAHLHIPLDHNFLPPPPRLKRHTLSGHHRLTTTTCTVHNPSMYTVGTWIKIAFKITALFGRIDGWELLAAACDQIKYLCHVLSYRNLIVAGV